MTELPLTEQDKADLARLGLNPEEVATERCLLEVWAAVLDSVEGVGAKPIPINVAAKVVASWPALSYQDTKRYHELYHRVLGEARDLLTDLLQENPDAKSWVGDEDAEHNHGLYRDILVGWHNLLDDYEQEWRAEDEGSHIWVAVLIDVRAFFFSRMGFAGHLDSIGFSLTDGEFLEAVDKSREEQGE